MNLVKTNTRKYKMPLKSQHRLPLFLFLVLSGCCATAQKPQVQLHEVKAQHKAGTSYVAVTYVEPWDAIKDQLKPEFNMSGEKALNKVIPQTSLALNKLLSVTRASLGIGWGGTTTNSTVTQDQTNDQPPTTQRHIVQQTSPGEAPSVSQSSDRNAKDIAGTDVLGKEMAQDPILQYSTALALDQEVQLLNRYVSGIPTRSGYTPYLVRLQVTLFPYARYEPYDAYTSLSFFSGNKSEGNSVDRPPIVIPLVVTDSMEGTLTSTANETVRQFALALGGIVQNAQAKAELQKLSDDLRAASGTDLNSLQSVGRSSDNSIQVRFGARRSPVGDSTYVMVPQTHNVTLLLLAPPQGALNRKVELTSRTVFYHATNGERLPSLNSEDLDSALAEIASVYRLDSTIAYNYRTTKTERDDDDKLRNENEGNVPLNKKARYSFLKKVKTNSNLDKVPQSSDCFESDNPLAPQVPNTADEVRGTKQKILTRLFNFAHDNNYVCFDKATAEYFEDKSKKLFLWNDLTIISSSLGFSKTLLELPEPNNPSCPPQQDAYPPQQDVLLEDDGKDFSTAYIIGGKNLSAEHLFSTLQVTGKGLALDLAALSISFGEKKLKVVFPSLTKLGLPAGGGTDAHLRISCGCAQDPSSAQQSYGVIAAKIEPTVDPGFRLETAVSAIPIKTDNVGEVSVYLTFKKANKVDLSISGGEIRSATSPSNKGAGNNSVAVDNGVVTVAGESGSRAQVTLSVANLLDGGTLKISGSGFMNKEKLGEAPPVNVALKSVEKTSSRP